MRRRALRIGAIAALTFAISGVGMLVANAVMQVWAYSSNSPTLTVGSVPAFAVNNTITCAQGSAAGVYKLTWQRPDVPDGVNLASYKIVAQTTSISGGGLLGANTAMADGDWSPGKWGSATANMKAIDDNGNTYSSGAGSASGSIPWLRFPNNADSSTITYTPPQSIQGSASSGKCASAAACTYNMQWGIAVGTQMSTRKVQGSLTLSAQYAFDATNAANATVLWSTPPVTVKWEIDISTLGAESNVSCTVSTS